MSRKLEERLEQLKTLRGRDSGDDLDPVLRKALQDRSNLVVAEAARLVSDQHRASLIPDLLTTFHRMFEDPVKADSKCWAKTAIVKALTALDYSDSAPFVRALGHIQMEPVWGGQEDAAIHLRANAALALVQCDDVPRALVFRHLVDALADSADPVRIEAVRALEQLNGEESILLLRSKAHAGDRRPHVMGQVFDSLLQLERERGVDFVARFLADSNEEIRDEAALSLGASRLPAAVQSLIETWQASRSTAFRSVLLRALSSSREDSALAFLLKLVREATSRDVEAALQALELHKDSPEIQQMILDARKEREA